MPKKFLHDEETLDLIRSSLPDPIHEESTLDGDVFTAGEGPDVVVHVFLNDISVSIYAAVWEEVVCPTLKPRQIGSLNSLELVATDLKKLLPELIQAAIRIRHSEYRKCNYCQEKKPPEWMHGKTVCQGCAQEYLGIVY